MTITSNTSTINVSTPTLTENMEIGIVPNPCYIGDGSLYISNCREYESINIWKVLISWNSLEPSRGNFNITYMNALKAILNAAYTDNKKVQLSFNQAYWPSWTSCTSNSCNNTYPRFTNSTINNYLKDVWILIVNQLKDYLALDSYLIINEDGALQKGISISNYINANNVIVTAIRSIDTSHKTAIRSLCTGASNYTLLRHRISTEGFQDVDYGITNYPTAATSCNPHNESPTSVTSCFMTDANLREPYKYAGKPTALGEIGFYKGTSDTWRDTERLKAFKRSMAIVYELGCKEFMMWSCGGDIEKGGGFRNPTTYFPQLKTFRDLLITKTRPAKYNVRVLLDNTNWLNVGWYPNCSSPTVIPSNQPYLHLMRKLDEGGYSWFYVHNEAAAYLTNYPYDRTISTSEILGKNITEQTILIDNRLSGVTANGNYYPWSGTNIGDVILR